MSEKTRDSGAMDLSVIIVNWNSKDYLRKCLASIRANAHGINYELVVIDAGSFDGCGEMLQQDFPWVRFIQSDKNLGFARANNLAFKSSRGKDVLFLNPDTEVSGPAIQTLSERLHSLPQAGAVGCKLLNSDGTVQTSCIQAWPTILNQLLDSEFLRARWPKSPLWGMSALFSHDDTPQTVEGIAGACVMLRREIFERVGMFSEDYFMYAEDMDLCYKLAAAGYRNYYIPQAVVIHHGGGSSSEAPSDFSTIMMRESIWRFLRKTRGSGYGLGYRVSILFSALVRIALLVALFPFRQARQRRNSRGGALQKWRAALIWSTSGERVLRQYHPACHEQHQ